VAGALGTQLVVLLGNLNTASVMDEMGSSTGGWSKVGVGVAKALQDDLDVVMNNVSSMLLEGMEHVAFVQDALDSMLSMAGNITDDAVKNSTELSLLQKEGPAGLSMLQMGQAVGASSHNATDIMAGLTPLIMQAVHNVLENVDAQVMEALDALLAKLRPALDQVARWVVKFGDKIQAGLETFTVTLDLVQKLFDQVMAQLNGRGANEEEMLNQTFALFDSNQNGYITAEDLHQVADLYSMTAFQGEKADILVKKYDEDGSGQIGKEEMRKLVNDPSIPSAMPVMLRTYARRLAEISGNVAAARQRDEVALAVTDYLTLVCAKNMTKVGWIADRLGNNSLPMEFTADVLVQLCLTEDDPGRLTSISAGQVVVGEMYRLHPDATLASLDLLSNTTFWDEAGFDVRDQPTCVEHIAGWVSKAASMLREHDSLLQVAVASNGQTTQEADLHARTLEAMPEVAGQLARESVSLFIMERQHRELRRNRQLFHSGTHKMLLAQLTGGLSVKAATSGNSEVTRAAKMGEMARPETLEFAQWLALNASETARERQQMCFEYSSESSSAMDTFATQVKSLVAGVQSFLDLMDKYARPGEITKLEKTIEEFAEKGMRDVMSLVENKLVALLNNSGPALEQAVRTAAHSAGERIGKQLGMALGSPLGEALEPAVKEVVKEMTNSSMGADNIVGQKLSKEIGDFVANMTSDAIAKQTGDLLENLVDSALGAGSGAATDLLKQVSDRFAPKPVSASLLQTARTRFHADYHRTHTSRRLRDQVEAFEGVSLDKMLLEMQGSRAENPVEDVANALTGAWSGLISMLQGLVHTLPAAVSSLKFARREVSKLSSNLDHIFSTFEDRGPSIFDGIAGLYRNLWLAYFIAMVPLNIMVLYYACWAGGYFGGPQPIPEVDAEGVAPRSFREKCTLCYGSVSSGFQKFHDTSLCFWSVVLLMQAFVLVIFIASIVMCILAGIKAFVLSGCEQVYILGDTTVCTGALDNIRNFVSSFAVGVDGLSLDMVCEEERLLTCDLIRRKMATSGGLTVVASFVASMISLQLIVDSALRHEQARWRRAAHALYLKEAAADEGPAAASSTGAA